MKQYIVLMAMIALGIFIYGCITGSDDSLLASVSDVQRYEIAVRSEEGF
jgi:hypothetical protein